MLTTMVLFVADVQEINSDFKGDCFLTYTFFNVYEECGYPLHLAVADLAHSHSRSTELIQSLSKIGAALNKSTHDRFMMRAVEKLDNDGGSSVEIDGSTPPNFYIDNVDSTRP